MSEREQRFLAIVEDSQARLRGIARAYADRVGGTEDLYQSMLLQIWRALPDFRGDADIRTWVYRVALNTALQARRRDTGSPAPVSLGDIPVIESAFADPAPGPDVVADTDSRVNRLLQLIRTLKEADRALIVLYLEDTPYQVIADALGISRSNVGARLHRLKKHLAERMREETA